MAPEDSTPFLAPAVDEHADTGAATSTEAPAASALNFGVLFQAPDLQARAPRREERDNSERNNERDDTTPTEPQDGGADGADGDEDESTSSRSRRRGGRGRRSKDGDGSSSTDDVSSSEDAEHNQDAARDEQGEESAAGDSEGSQNGKKGRRSRSRSRSNRSDRDSGETGKQGADESAADDAHSTDKDDDETGDGSRRRTRRRRRSGGATDSNDPPGTVTKVREPRKDRDEVTSIKGSTRLEAKKQRRREGREAGRRRTVITEAEFLARRESVDRVMVVREKDGRTQIGVLEDGVLVEHYVSREVQQSSMAGNVYLGKVQNVLPSMEAAFVDIGRGRNAVLYAGEVNWDAAGLENGQAKRIENALKSGDNVLVQVTKDPIGHKGARLTSQVSLPGRYLVYVPGNSMTGISRKLPDTERARLKKILKEVVPSDAGVIVRTAAEGASEVDLRADVERLQAQWEQIQQDAKTASAPSLLHGEPDLTVRVIRDVFNEDFSKLVVSGDKAWDQVHGYLSSVAPDLADRLEKWTGELDVFSVHRIDEQLAKAMDRKVWLPSGGSLIIDRTEAMTVIDVNTGKFVGSGGNLEETVTKNNIEAAEEIVRQLRLRDIGGIIVVDFIDMVLESNRDLVVRRLLECLGRDRTKHQVAEVTSLGLVQMTRKRVGAGLVEVFSEPCEHCNGRGIIVHSDPVDKPSGSGQGSNTGGSGKSRKSRGKRQQQDDTSGNGPTAAQIAAAAHAAAKIAGSGAGSDADDLEIVDAEIVDDGDNGDDTAAEQTVAVLDAQSEVDAAPVKPVTGSVTGRVGAHRRAAEQASADEDSAPREDVTQPGATAKPETTTNAEPPSGRTGRARRRRATSAAGAATHVTPPSADVVTAPAATTHQVAVGSGSADEVRQAREPKATAPQAAAEVTPKRRKRARVVAPAGPPVAEAEGAADAASTTD